MEEYLFILIVAFGLGAIASLDIVRLLVERKRDALHITFAAANFSLCSLVLLVVADSVATAEHDSIRSYALYAFSATWISFTAIVVAFCISRMR